MRLAWLVWTTTAVLSAQTHVLAPAGAAKPVGPYTPALATGNYIYVSGQGVRDGNGAMPDGIEAQTRQCFANVRASLQAGGLDFSHVAAAQLYLTNMADLPVVQRLWAATFSSHAPPRITLGVVRLPTDTTIELTVVARRNPDQRIYLTPIYAETRQQADDQLAAALKTAGLTRQQIVMATWYTTAAPAPGVVSVTALPANARWAVSAIAAKSPQSTTVFCPLASPAAAGSVEQQTVDVFSQLKACLAKQGATLDDLVATNVYLADLADFATMNAAYAAMFHGPFPTRTTIQAAAPSRAAGTSVRISAIAEKHPPK